MKRTVIIILAVLPIVMVIAIAFAGRIFSIYRYIPIEKVYFANEVGDELDSSFVFTVNVGESLKADVRVFPELASNKKLTYTSADESICTVDKNGVITGVSLGSTTVLVKSVDGGKNDLLTVRVTDDNVRGVSLSEKEITLSVSGTKTLTATVEPYSAVNKNVLFTSDNPEVVTVNSNGKITAVSVGTATVTVTTVDGGFSDCCTVTVVDSVPPLYFDFSESDEISAFGSGYKALAQRIDLAPYVRIGADGIDLSSVRYKIASGGSSAVINGSEISFTGNGIVKIVIYVGDYANPTYQAEISVVYFN